MTRDELIEAQEKNLETEIAELAAGDPAENERPEAIMRFFSFSHLRPGPGRVLSSHFASLAVEVCNSVKPSAERTVALRKLLEGKDAAVRACLP